MGSLIIFFLALIAFSVSSRGLLSAVTENVNLLRFTEGYSHQALKISKYYKVVAWGFLTLFLFATAVQTFLTVFLSV